jgi:hypothetical protein
MGALVRSEESLPVRLVKHPFVWSGTGLLVRYYDDPTVTGTLWKVAGLAALAFGVGQAVSTQQIDPTGRN